MATRKEFFHHGSLCLLSLFSSPFTFPNLINDDFKGIVLNEDEGEVYQYPDRVTGEGTRRLTIKVSKLRGSNNISYVSESFTPGDAIQLHMHSNEEELIFVHKGSGIFTLDEKEFPVRAGAIALVPRNTWHGLKIRELKILKCALPTSLPVLRNISAK